VISDGAFVIGLDGRIVAIGSTQEIDAQYSGAKFGYELDLTGKSVVPGLCDAHTHPVWSGDRVHEFAMKLAGATYMDVHKMGGGIGFTVSFCELIEQLCGEFLFYLARREFLMKCNLV
jgi:imidazolonepropionase